MKDKKIVDSFVAFMAATRVAGLKVERRPDEEKNGDIDAIAGPFAIEHTSIDTVPDQRRDGAWLGTMLGDLESKTVVSENMQVVFNPDAVRPGQDWAAINAALKSYLEGPARGLPQNRYVPVRIDGVPFDVHIFKWQPVPSLPPRVTFGRFAPGDATLGQRLREQSDRKIEKLAPYQAEGKCTILLLESDDVALMNHVKMASAVMDAYPQGRPTSVDELWYVSSILQPELHFLDLSTIWALPEGERFPVPTTWSPR
jgi:hypothetical protein